MTDFVTPSERRIARKAHRCDNCGGRINAGEPYQTHFQVWEGEPCRWREHIACQRASEIVAEYMDGSDLQWEGIPLVFDMGQEDRWTVMLEAPEIYEAIWGGCRGFDPDEDAYRNGGG